MQERLNHAISLLDTPIENVSIGIQKEKILHKIIKYYINADPSCHEIKIGNNYADVVTDGIIYEIQTQNFNLLRKKLDTLLKQNQVVIVYPACRIKQIYSINEYGEYIKQAKSPKKGTPFQILVEMYKIRDYLTHPNLSFKVLYLDMDEYREVVPKKHYRSKGYIRYKQVPTNIVEEYNLKTSDDYIDIFNTYNCPTSFTTTDFSKCFKISTSKASNAIKSLETLDIVVFKEKIGRKKLWAIKKCKTT